MGTIFARDEDSKPSSRAWFFILPRKDNLFKLAGDLYTLSPRIPNQVRLCFLSRDSNDLCKEFETSHIYLLRCLRQDESLVTCPGHSGPGEYGRI